MRMKKQVSIIALLAIATFLLSGIATSTTSAQVAEAPKKGGTFITCLPGDPMTMNPGITTSLYSHTSSDAAFNSLLETNMDLSLAPGLAEKWQASSDAMTFTFNLVKNATWHDGKKLTSADVKFTFEQILSPFHPQGMPNFGGIKSIETPDDFTVRFTMSKPSPGFFSW